MTTNQPCEQSLNKDKLDILLNNAIESQREVKRSLNRLTFISILFFCLAASIELGVLSNSKIKSPGISFEIDASIAFPLFILIASIFSLLRTLSVINLYVMREKISKYYYLQFKSEIDMIVFSSPTIINLLNRAIRKGVIGFCVVMTFIIFITWQSLELAPYITEAFERQSENGKHLLLISAFLIVLSGAIEMLSVKASSYLAN